MLRNADISQSYNTEMLPWIKNESKRAKIIKDAQKNSEMYLDKNDNGDEVVTMETIFSKLTKGMTGGRRE